ncbi:MAG: ribulokinase [Clostridia bacterium]|nr:ribulokinase [Clostridia bacterium]
MAELYSIGIDFGTLSGRAVLVNIMTGEEVCTSVYEYPHAVMDEALPCGKKLPPDYALEHPQDYVDVLAHTVPDVIKQANIDASQVIGVGIDHTACTVLPVKEDGTPLCMLDEYKDEPHAYIKLWKHHAAQGQADKINELAEKRGESFLARYGGKISSEWMFPKIMQVAEEAPEIYDAADRFIEATDWVVWVLTGVETHNSCTAGYKGIWSKKEGFPSNDFLKELCGKLDGIVGTKVSDKILPLGTKAGGISEKAALLTGLKEGTAVAVGNVDAHVALPAAGITGPGKMLMIMGTSTCHILMSDKENIVPGMCGVVEDGVLAGYFGYEAGQSCVGDHFDWFVKNCVPASYAEDAKAKGMNIHKYLREKAKKLKPGESGLVALDWFNGNRSVLVDADLTGVILGMTLQTKPEEIYRALIEATAYGTRMIIDNYEKYGVKIDELYAAGGIAEKDEMMMQIYADVTGRTIKIAASAQSPALGSAIFGAAASGKVTMNEACERMGKIKDVVYTPIEENKAVYDKLFAEYEILHDYYGRGENDVMKRLKAIKKEARQ